MPSEIDFWILDCIVRSDISNNKHNMKNIAKAGRNDTNKDLLFEE